MAEGNRSLVNSLIDQLKLQAAPRPATAEQARGGPASSLSTHAHLFAIAIANTYYKE